eukprot:scaffold2751_cov344-Prasinococcus_capsulatus_cf.AAC.8
MSACARTATAALAPRAAGRHARSNFPRACGGRAVRTARLACTASLLEEKFMIEKLNNSLDSFRQMQARLAEPEVAGTVVAVAGTL